VETGPEDAVFNGRRYTPDKVSENYMGAEIGTLRGGTIPPGVGDLTSELWRRQ
jgi:ribosomal protein S19